MEELEQATDVVTLDSSSSDNNEQISESAQVILNQTEQTEESELEKIQKLLKQEESNRNKFKKRMWISAVCIGLLTPTLGFGGVMLGNQVVKQQAKTNTLTKITTVNRTQNLGISELVSKISPTVVEIQRESSGFNASTSMGSGVIISEDGYIVSNYHVIIGNGNSDTSKITVKLKDGTQYNATVVGSDSRTDLAVIKIDAKNLTKAELMNSDQVAVGEDAIAIGNSLGVLGGTVTKGIVSGVNRESSVGTYKLALIQTDAPVNEGNSGGGLFNDSGQLIGIVTQKASGETVEGLGFAIPSNVVSQISKDIISNGYVKERPTIGISVQEVTKNQLFRSRLEEAGVYVSESTNESLKRYDLLKEVDGVKIENADDVLDAISDNKIGDVIKVKVVRDGSEIAVDVTLKEATR